MSMGERSRIKIRVRSAMAAHGAAIEGRFLGGHPPYGFTLANARPHANLPGCDSRCTSSNLTRPHRLLGTRRVPEDTLSRLYEPRFSEPCIAGPALMTLSVRRRPVFATRPWVCPDG